MKTQAGNGRLAQPVTLHPASIRAKPNQYSKISPTCRPKTEPTRAPRQPGHIRKGA